MKLRRGRAGAPPGRRTGSDSVPKLRPRKSCGFRLWVLHASGDQSDLQAPGRSSLVSCAWLWFGPELPCSHQSDVGRRRHPELTEKIGDIRWKSGKTSQDWFKSPGLQRRGCASIQFKAREKLL